MIIFLALIEKKLPQVPERLLCFLNDVLDNYIYIQKSEQNPSKQFFKNMSLNQIYHSRIQIDQKVNADISWENTINQFGCDHEEKTISEGTCPSPSSKASSQVNNKQEINKCEIDGDIETFSGLVEKQFQIIGLSSPKFEGNQKQNSKFFQNQFCWRQAFIRQKEETEKNAVKHKPIVGGKQYLAALSINDSESKSQFLMHKQKLISGKSEIFWTLDRRNEQCSMLEPNIISFPKQNILVQFELKELRGQNTLKDKFKANLENLKEGRYILQCLGKKQRIELQLEIVQNWEKKKQIFQEMNFKFPFLQIESICLLLNIKTDIREPICPHELVQYLKTSQGSRQYQKQIPNMSSSQLFSLTTTIQPFLTELIMNQFANYMIQTLFVELSSLEKINFMHNVTSSLNYILSTKEGTFTFQQFLSWMDFSGIKTLFEALKNTGLKELCFNVNSAHFLRKLITFLGENQCLTLLEQLSSSFSEIINSKQGACVLKEFIRIAPNYPALQIRLLHLMLSKLERALPHEYGNYLIHQAYEKWSQESLKPLTDSIIKGFVCYALQKYSSLVLAKCLKTYWKASPEIYLNVKAILKKKDLKLMRKSFEGMKVVKELQGTVF